MGNQNCCIASARRAELGHADFVANMNDPFRQHNPPIKRTPQLDVIPEMEDPLSCSTSGGYKQGRNEKAKNISLQQLQGNTNQHARKNKVSRKKPPPLMDFESAKEDTTVAHTAMQLTSYAGASDYNTNIQQQLAPENVLDDDEEPQNHHEKRGESDYWDVLDEDKNLSVRLSEKAIMTREYYSCMETLAQEEAGPKTSIVEANSRKAVQKTGEEETEPEEEYEDDCFEISQSKDIMSSQKFNSRPSLTDQAANARFIKGKPESASSRFEDSNLLTERLNQILTEERRGPLPAVEIPENNPVISVTKVEENNKPMTNYHSFESPMPQIRFESQNQRVMATPPTIEKEENLRKIALEDKSAHKNHSIGCLETTSLYAENTLRGPGSAQKDSLTQLKSASKLAKQQYDDYEQRDQSPLKYSDLVKEEKPTNNYTDQHHLYKSIEIKQNPVSPLKSQGLNVMSDNDLVNKILENRSISMTGLNQGKTRENWSKEIHNQLDTIRENIWQKRQLEKLVQQAQNSQNSYRAEGGYSQRGGAKSVEKFASSLGENDPNYILAQRRGIERASRLIQSRERSDLSSHYRSGRSVNNSEVDISGSSMDMKDMRMSKRYENIVKDDVKKLMEKALNPKSKRLDVYLHQEREKRSSALSGREVQGKSDWKGLLQKKADYSHPVEQSHLRAYSPERRSDLANINIAQLLKK